jgi:hypothetical protein
MVRLQEGRLCQVSLPSSYWMRWIAGRTRCAELLRGPVSVVRRLILGADSAVLIRTCGEDIQSIDER